MRTSKMQYKLFRNIFVISIFLSNAFVTLAKKDDSSLNDRPIIGVLAQEIVNNLTEKYQDMFDSYISASYVKFVESAGARVVPIWIGKKDSYYEDILSKINGVLFPGGDADFNDTNGYADAGEIIYKIATRYNENGDYFPIWGTCLGFELMTYLAANRFEHRSSCSSVNQALPLIFTSGYENSRLFKNAPADIINILKKENVTGNWHTFCVTKQDLIRANLSQQIRVMSVNYDRNHIKSISTLEHVKLPFYATMFHPEKNAFEWVEGRNIPHSPNSIKVTNYFADFFVNEARKNHHKFLSRQEENKALIYNFSPYFAGINGSYFDQVYMFKGKNTVNRTMNYIVAYIINHSVTNP